MQKSKNMFIFFVTALLVCLTMLACFSPSFSYVSLSKETMLADDSQLPRANTLAGEFDISIIPRNSSNITLQGPYDYVDSQAYRVNWADAQSFSISFVCDDSNPPPLNALDPENPNTYVFSIRVYYSKSYFEANNFEDVQYFEDIYTFTSSDYHDFATIDYQLNIDNFLGSDVNWGIYRFVVDINSAESVSLYYAIEPTRVVAELPQISYDTPSSATGSLQNLYSFYLLNESAFRFVDKRNLTWYVYGQTIDGRKYALTYADLGNEYFRELNCTETLWDSYEGGERNGTTFDLEINDLYGTWQVWCVYDYNGTSSSMPDQNNIIELRINAPFDYINVLYIILGICGFFLILTIIIIIVKIKKEKVW